MSSNVCATLCVRVRVCNVFLILKINRLVKAVNSSYVFAVVNVLDYICVLLIALAGLTVSQ